MKIIHILPEIDKAIWDKDTAIAKKKRGQGRHHNTAVVPAETILAMRRLHEVERLTMQEVERAYPQFSCHYVRDVLGYIVRANLQISTVK